MTTVATPITSHDPFADDVLANPYPLYDALRHLGPTVWLDRHEAWLITGHMEAKTVLADPATFPPVENESSGRPQNEAPRRQPDSPPSPEAALHIAAQADQLVAEHTRHGSLDAAALAEQYMSDVVLPHMGIARDERRQALGAGFTLSPPAPRPDRAHAITTLGVATHGIATALRLLAIHRAEFTKLRDGEVGGSNVFHEALRYDAPVQTVCCRASRSAGFARAQITEGDLVFVSYGAAGRDPRKWGIDAHKFVPQRRAVSEHLALGSVPQAPPWYALVVVAASTLLTSVAKGCTGLRLDGDPVAVRRHPLRGWQSVPMTTLPG